jgi:hypothetical protein
MCLTGTSLLPSINWILAGVWSSTNRLSEVHIPCESERKNDSFVMPLYPEQKNDV